MCTGFNKLNDLDQGRNHIREFKDELLKEVNKAGGINERSKVTHIPQPSLSRFFNSNAMPMHRTVLKIAEALNLDAVCINMPWTTYTFIGLEFRGTISAPFADN